MLLALIRPLLMQSLPTMRSRSTDPLCTELGAALVATGGRRALRDRSPTFLAYNSFWRRGMIAGERNAMSRNPSRWKAAGRNATHRFGR